MWLSFPQGIPSLSSSVEVHIQKSPKSMACMGSWAWAWELAFWCAFRQQCGAQDILAMGFASQDWLSAKCSFLSLSPFCFHQHLGHRPRATMDVNLDALGGQKKTSDSSKGSDSPGVQQGHYPCMNNNWNAMLDSLQDSGLLPFHNLTKGCPLPCPLYSQLQISVL